MRSVFVSFAAALWVPLLASCFSPASPSGLACSPNDACPDGQICSIEGICRAQLCSPACDLGEVCDYDTLTCIAKGDSPIPESTEDSRPHIGSIGGVPGSVLATVVSPYLALTCSDCLADADAGELSVNLGQTTVDVEQIVHHTRVDLAALHLASARPVPALSLADAPPGAGVSLVSIVPGINGNRFQQSVRVDEVGGEAYSWTSQGFDPSMACAIVGGPTFSAEGGDDVLMGLHGSVACATGGTQDLRIDAFRTWIEQEMEAAAPEECPDTGTCSGCGSWSCSDDSGSIVETCAPDDSRCGSDQTCDQNLTCRDNAVCDGDDIWIAEGSCGVRHCVDGQWGALTASDAHCQMGNALRPVCNPSDFQCDCDSGQYLTCPGTGCGRRYCEPDTGNYGYCSSYDSLCESYETCNYNGYYYDCYPDPSQTCSTANYEECPDATAPKPDYIPIGDTFLTKTGCGDNKCKICECTLAINGLTSLVCESCI